MRMTDYVNGFLRAEDIEPHVKLEDVITDVKTTDFDEKGEIISKPVISLLRAWTQIVLNQTLAARADPRLWAKFGQLARQKNPDQPHVDAVWRQDRGGDRDRACPRAADRRPAAQTSKAGH